ncbi:MAG: TlpA disulfide reductase family protein [Candidatus Marinimicrobia bacterium]|jgi:thioredoxin-related protein|nr:TlpA disulfide reductase family protein [Candidatus Neomarinimicrobiota bacterium]|tara:strand:+ start:2609 stop:2992 length:384 start_codon:yes stop_codon:yes gene_type:complete
MQAAYLNQLNESFGDAGLKVLGVNLNSPTIINQVRPWINKRKINFDISVDPGEKLAKSFNVKGLPTLFLVDKDGNIINETIGFSDGYESKYLEALTQYLDNEKISYQDFEYKKENKAKKDVTLEIDF